MINKATVVSLFLCLTIGCAAQSNIIPTMQPKEPTVITVRNNSGDDLERVSLYGASGGGSMRVGSISPVPRGVSQQLGRPSSPPPLPLRGEVCWVGSNAQQLCRAVSLQRVLAAATGQPGEALVFELLPAAEVRVFLEQTQ